MGSCRRMDVSRRVRDMGDRRSPVRGDLVVDHRPGIMNLRQGPRRRSCGNRGADRGGPAKRRFASRATLACRMP